MHLASFKSLPFFFPLGVLFVDDEEDFLELIPKSLQRSMPYRSVFTATSGEHGIETMKELPFNFSTLPDKPGFVWEAGGHIKGTYSHKGIDMLDELSVHAKNIGMVIFDYAMQGGMDGLAFSEQVSCPGKIFLTAQASTEQANDAFNRRLTSAYIPKDRGDLKNVVENEIQKIEMDFFKEKNSDFARIARAAMPFLSDKEVCTAILSVLEKLSPVFCAPNFDPPGLLIQSANGDRFFMPIFDEVDISVQLRRMPSDTTAEMVEKLKRKECLLYSEVDFPNLPFLSTDKFVESRCADLYKLANHFYCAVLKLEPSRSTT